MSPTPPARRLRLGLPRRVFSQVLLMQVAIAAGVAVLATGLFLAPLSDQLDDQAMRRALAIAQTTAQQPGLAEEVRDTPARCRRRPSGSGGPPRPSTSW
jgi:two-component system CitB family sensor kinase